MKSNLLSSAIALAIAFHAAQLKAEDPQIETATRAAKGTYHFFRTELRQASKLKNHLNDPDRMADEAMLQGLGIFLFPLKIEAAKDVRRHYEKQGLSPEANLEMFEYDVEKRRQEYLFRILQESENRERLRRSNSYELV